MHFYLVLFFDLFLVPPMKNRSPQILSSEEDFSQIEWTKDTPQECCGCNGRTFPTDWPRYTLERGLMEELDRPESPLGPWVSELLTNGLHALFKPTQTVFKFIFLALLTHPPGPSVKRNYKPLSRVGRFHPLLTTERNKKKTTAIVILFKPTFQTNHTLE